MMLTLPGRAGRSLALAVTLTLTIGCAAPDVTDRGLVTGSAGMRELALPAGVERAVIFTIDGVRIPPGQRTVQVNPGTHSIRAAPVIPGPVHQVPSAETLATRYENRTITVDVIAGNRYVIGVRWIEPFNYQRGSGSYEAVAFAPCATARRVLDQAPP